MYGTDKVTELPEGQKKAVLAGPTTWSQEAIPAHVPRQGSLPGKLSLQGYPLKRGPEVIVPIPNFPQKFLTQLYSLNFLWG